MIRNILFVSHSAELNGAEKMLLQTLEKINREKFCPFLILPKRDILDKEVEKLGFETEIVPMRWWLTERSKIWKQPLSWAWNLGSVFRISRIIRKKKISLVLSNSSVAFSGALAAKIEGIPHIWSVHEILYGSNPLLRFFFGKRALISLISGLSSRVIVNSHASQKAFKQQKKVRLVYSGLDISQRNLYPKNILKKQHGLKNQDIVLGVVGKIYEEKGQREVILAVSDLCQSFPQIKLLIVGVVKDRGYYLTLQKIVKMHNLVNRVIFTGFRKDILNILRLMDLLVVASQVESFGRSVIEAMAVETPVLAVKAGGIPEIISNGKNGFLMESREPEIIKKAVEVILNNPSKTADVEKEGFQTVKKRFSLKKQVKKIEKIIEECLE